MRIASYRPSGSSGDHLLACLVLLLLLLLSCCYRAASASPLASSASSTFSSSLDLPELARDIHTLTCSPGGCAPVSPETTSPFCTTPNVVLVYDDVACFLAATAHAGFRPFDLAKGSGGEVVMCKQLLNLLNVTRHTFLVTKSVPSLERCVLAGRAQGVEHVLFVHGAWWNLQGDKFAGGYRIKQPFREECLVSMTLWGASKPHALWPGDLRYYVTSFPTQDNSYVLMQKPAHCPTSNTYRPPRLPVYGVLFEKFKVMPWKVNMTKPFSHNATLWAELQRRVHLVVLDCTDALAAKLQWGSDYRERVTCWKDSPLSQQYSYHDLLMGAAFFLGLGATPQSPTPVDANYCRTPMIMPPTQHSFIPRYARPGEFYPVTSSENVVRAVDDILTNCKVDFVRGGDGEPVTKTSSCFQDPPSLDEPMNITRLADSFAKLVKARLVPCVNRPRRVVPSAPAPLAGAR